MNLLQKYLHLWRGGGSSRPGKRRGTAQVGGRRVYIEGLENRRVMAAGDLDSTFSGDGYARFTNGGNSSAGRALAVQNDGKIVVAGFDLLDQGDHGAYVLRLTPSGATDNTFDGNGVKVVGFGVGQDDYANDVVIQPDGKILVAGHTDFDGGGDFFVFRLTASGALDKSFSSDGKVQINVRQDDFRPSIALQSDGKIVLAGTTVSGGEPSADIALVRLQSNGTLDTSFSNDGKTAVDTSGVGNPDHVAAIAIASNGKYIVGGSTVASVSGDWQINWFHSSGSLYRTKRIVHGGDDGLEDMVLTSSGIITAVGYSRRGTSYIPAIARLTSKGIYDTTFDGATNGNGRILIDFPSDYVHPTSIELMSDGKILIGGFADVVGDFDMAVAKLTSSGRLDTSFSGDGYQVYGFSDPDPGTLPNDYINDMVIFGGKLIAVGETYGSEFRRLGAIRVLL